MYQPLPDRGAAVPGTDADGAADDEEVGDEEVADEEVADEDDDEDRDAVPEEPQAVASATTTTATRAGVAPRDLTRDTRDMAPPGCDGREARSVPARESI